MAGSRLALATAAIVAAVAATPALGAVATVRLDAEPRVGAIADGRLWVLADRGATRVLIEADRVTGRPTGREAVIATGVPRDPAVPGNAVVPPSLAAAAHGLWTVDPVTGDAVRVETATAAVGVRVPIGARFIASGSGGVWAAAGGTVEPGGIRYDIVQLSVRGGDVGTTVTYGPGLGVPLRFVVATTGIWIARAGGAKVVRVDKITGSSRFVRAGSWVLALSNRRVLSTPRRSCVVTIQPREDFAPLRREPRRVVRMCRPPYLAFPRDVTSSGSAVWLATVRRARAGWTGHLARRSFDAGGPLRAWRVGRDPVDVVPSGRGVWVLSRSDRTMTRVTP